MFHSLAAAVSKTKNANQCSICNQRLKMFREIGFNI